MVAKKDGMKTAKRKIIIFITVGTLVVFAGLCYWGWSVYKKNVRLMENIKLATANPEGLSPGALVNRIDRGFSKLPREEQNRILNDPKLLAERIEQASFDNYKQAFGTLFSLPEPLRKQLIRNSADKINSSIDRNPVKVEAFYESEAGKAAMRAASRYFMLELNGKQKNELQPLTDAFNKIHRRMAKGNKK
ncbi:MAG: hypothetical protein JXR78_02525 [Victivallales bacterium]|nr:hypothetical protein [Victivallales bacterium]